jgi:S-formylglutathione hydrolase FrmB
MRGARELAWRRARGSVGGVGARAAVGALVAAVVLGGTAHPLPPHRLAAARSAAARSAASGGPTARGAVRADSFWSPALGIRKRFVVYLPPSYGGDPARRYPVAYYLHGMWGGEWDWVRLGRLDATLDSLGREMIVVMPDGDDGWYTTWNFLGDYAGCRRAPPREGEGAESYCVPWPKYDEYIARDLVAHVDSAYRTVARREGRGVAGLSMGGYGAVTLALRYPDVFAAAASHSGVLSPLYAGPSPFAPPPRYATSVDSVRARWGGLWKAMRLAFGTDTIGWAARDPARLARRARRDALPALLIDTGVEDRLVVDGNRALHHELEAMGIAHVYREWPGGHDWDYWRSHVDESLAWLADRLGAARGR